MGLDYDTKSDLKKTVDFCKEINSFSIQPPPLTIYPGTVLFEQFEKDRRIITKDWDYYDMMHVMFIPKNMTPLDLQNEFYKALWRFYSFSSIFKILTVFGFSAFIKRFKLTILIKVLVIFSKFIDRRFYSILKNYSYPDYSKYKANE